jgi:hypothetical protein
MGEVVPATGPEASRSPVSQPERRVHRRVPLEALATFHDGDGVVTGRTLDVSLGGMGLESDRPPPEGTELEVTVELHPGSVVRAAGEVVRRERGVVGIRFVRLDQRSLTAILSHVARS